MNFLNRIIKLVGSLAFLNITPGLAATRYKSDESLVRYGSFTLIKKYNAYVVTTNLNGQRKIGILKDNKFLLTDLKTTGRYSFQLSTNPITYSIEINQNQVGLLVDTPTLSFDESAQLCDLQSHPADLLTNDLSTAIQKFASKSLFADESCDTLDLPYKKKLMKTVSNLLSPENSYILKCLATPETQKALAGEPKAADLAIKIIAKHSSDLDSIAKGNSPFKLSCAEQKKATYDHKSSLITIPIDGTSLGGSVCKTTEQVVVHELFHHSSLSEPEAKYLDTLCGKAAKSENIAKKECESEYPNSLAASCSAKCAAALIKTQKENNSKQKEKIAEAIKQEIKTAQFVPVQDADIQEITNPTTPERYNKSVDRVYTAMSTNLEKIAQPLNRAIAASVNTAEASTTLASDSSGKAQSTYKKSSLVEVSSARSPASNSRASANQEYTVEEILADKYNVPVESVRAAAASSELPTASTATPNTANVQQAKQQAQPRGGGAEIARAGSAGAGAALNSATQGGVPGRSTSSGPNLRNPASTGGGAPVQDNTIKQLGTFNEIRGEKYKRIQERYSDPTFGDELAQQGLAIEYKSKNMTIKIGNDRNALFRDDGKVLKKVTGAK